MAKSLLTPTIIPQETLDKVEEQRQQVFEEYMNDLLDIMLSHGECESRALKKLQECGLPLVIGGSMEMWQKKRYGILEKRGQDILNSM